MVWRWWDRVSIRQSCWVACNPLALYIKGGLLSSHEWYLSDPNSVWVQKKKRKIEKINKKRQKKESKCEKKKERQRVRKKIMSLIYLINKN